MKIEIDGVKITLTTEQLQEIKKQTSKYSCFQDIKSYLDACDHLGVIPDFAASSREQIKVITKAINSFSKKKEKFPDFKNNKQYKYYPVFDCSGGGFVFHCSDFRYFSFDGSVAYFPEKEMSDYMGKQFVSLYEKLLEEEY
jgi:hypothetical protein